MRVPVTSDSKIDLQMSRAWAQTKTSTREIRGPAQSGYPAITFEHDGLCVKSPILVVIAGKDGFDYLVRDPGAGSAKGLYPLRELGSDIEALRFYEPVANSRLSAQVPTQY